MVQDMAIMEMVPKNGLLLDAGCGYGVFELKFCAHETPF